MHGSECRSGLGNGRLRFLRQSTQIEGGRRISWLRRSWGPGFTTVRRERGETKAAGVALTNSSIAFCSSSSSSWCRSRFSVRDSTFIFVFRFADDEALEVLGALGALPFWREAISVVILLRSRDVNGQSLDGFFWGWGEFCPPTKAVKGEEMAELPHRQNSPAASSWYRLVY